MHLKNVHLVALLILSGLNTVQSASQQDQEEACSAPIYGFNELTRRAKINRYHGHQLTQRKHVLKACEVRWC